MIILQKKYDNLVLSIASLVIVILTKLAYQTLYAQVSNAISEFEAPKGSHPHDVAADSANNGPVWYTAQGSGGLGKLDSVTGKITHIQLGNASGLHMGSSASHGIIIGPDGGLWITEWNITKLGRYDPSTNKWQEWKFTWR